MIAIMLVAWDLNVALNEFESLIDLREPILICNLSIDFEADFICATDVLFIIIMTSTLHLMIIKIRHLQDLSPRISF